MTDAESRFKLGKKPARPDAVKFKLRAFTAPRALPTPPETFGHEGLIGPSGWLMLSNDKFGCCVWSGAAHEHMLLARIAKNAVWFNSKGVLADYAAVTGFDPHKPDTDQGTDMVKAASYRRTTGVIDRDGRRHKIAAYLALDPGDHQDVRTAAWLFGAVGIGIQFPGSAWTQFERAQAWDVEAGAEVDGGHYVPLVGVRREGLRVVTWGKAQTMTWRFFERYCDEAVAYVSDDFLVERKSPEGFDYNRLLDYLSALGR